MEEEFRGVLEEFGGVWRSFGGVLEDFWRSLEEYFGIFEVLRSTLCKSLVNCGELWNVKSNS